jgi:hypothetical protein
VEGERAFCESADMPSARAPANETAVLSAPSLPHLSLFLCILAPKLHCQECQTS